MKYLFLIATFIWIFTGIFWIIVAQNIKRSLKKEGIKFRFTYMVLWVVPFAITFFPILPKGWMYTRLFPQNLLIEIYAFIAIIISLAFMIWSRIVLGKNWSGRIAIKEDHQLITSGPYAMVRNPMYTGFIVAFLFSALLLGEVRGLVASIILIIGILMKLQKEEKFVREVFGKQYDDYVKKVKRLIPYIY